MVSTELVVLQGNYSNTNKPPTILKQHILLVVFLPVRIDYVSPLVLGAGISPATGTQQPPLREQVVLGSSTSLDVIQVR